MSVGEYLGYIDEGDKVLLAGLGGGFDVFAALPLLDHLLARKVEVVLSNLSFTNLSSADAEQVTESMKKITHETPVNQRYFPEAYLCKWLAQHYRTPIPIYAVDQTGAVGVSDAYATLHEQEKFSVIIGVDGGTDSLMRGDEYSLATPEEDSVSLLALSKLPVENKSLWSIGFGVDTFHGVNHYQFLQNVADLAKADAFRGAFSLGRQFREFHAYKSACDFVFECMPNDVSIVNSSIVSAVLGEYGDFHSSSRTAGSRLWINPLMSLYWVFDLDAVAATNMYLELIAKTNTYAGVKKSIESFRSGLSATKMWQELPA